MWLLFITGAADTRDGGPFSRVTRWLVCCWEWNPALTPQFVLLPDAGCCAGGPGREQAFSRCLENKESLYFDITHPEPTLRHRRARSCDILMLGSWQLAEQPATCSSYDPYVGMRGSVRYKYHPSLGFHFVNCTDECPSASRPFLTRVQQAAGGSRNGGAWTPCTAGEPDDSPL